MDSLNLVSFSALVVFALAATAGEPSAAARYAQPVRPGGVNGQPFWNAQAVQFTYAPAFGFATIRGAASYRYTVKDFTGATHVFTAPTPTAALSPIWLKLPENGRMELTVEALDAKGKGMGMAAGRRTFWKMPTFRPDGRPHRDYAAAASKCFDYIFELPSTQYFLKNGKPDPAYGLNAYPAKMHSALIRGMVRYARRRPDRRDAALKLARRAADYLISISQPAGTPLAHFPPTYDNPKEGPGLGGVGPKSQGKNMLLYPALAGRAYLMLFAETGEAKYRDAAVRIGDTYLRIQGEDGTCPLKVDEKTGKPVNANRAFPLDICFLLQDLEGVVNDARYGKAIARGLDYVRKGPMTTWNWEGQFEDVEPSAPYKNLTKHPLCDTAIFLLRTQGADPAVRKFAREAVDFTEDQFVCWQVPMDANGRGPRGKGGWGEDYAAWRCPAALEQYACYVPINASASKVMRTFLALWKVTRDPTDLAKAQALGDAMVDVQSADGRIPTFWIRKELVDPQADWLNCTIGSAVALDEIAELMRGKARADARETPGDAGVGARPPVAEIVAANDVERKAAAALREELCGPVRVVASSPDAVDFTRSDFIDAFAKRIFEPVLPAVRGYAPAAAKGRSSETIFLIDGIRNHARYRDFFESGLKPRLALGKVACDGGADALAVHALRAADGREAAFVFNKTNRKLAYEFTYGGNRIKSTIEPLWLNVHSTREVTVDFAKPGKAILPLNGTGGGPCLGGRGGSPQERKASFMSLNVASVRLHDIPYAVCNRKLVDVPQIFPLWIPKADPADPENYYFLATDDYLKLLKACGVPRITYRLGPSIEDPASQAHMYFTDPGDYNRYAEVCAGIVRHYTRGWAKGFDAGVTHWEVWNEPDLGDPANWAGTFDEYCDFYIVVAKRLKREFPEIKVGGPASCGSNKRGIVHFAERCAKAGAPVDFFSFHCYPFAWITPARIIPDLKEELARLGFGKAELHLNEWHYKPCSWGDLQTKEGWARWAEESEDGLNGADAGAFVAQAVTRWQDSGLSVANYYMTSCVEPVWGLFTSKGERRPPWWALKFLGSLSDGRRVADSSVGDLAILAGFAKDGARRVVVADFRSGTAAPVTLRLKGVPAGAAVRLETIDARHPFAPLVREQRLSPDAQVTVGGGSSSVNLVEILPPS